MAKRGRGHDKQGRSDGEARHIRLDYWMLEHPAFLALTPNAKVTLLAMLKRFNGRNNGRIAFGVRSGIFVPINGKELAEKPFGLSRFQIGRALADLEAAGFIACTQEATFGQKRLMREWRLTWLPCDGKLATREFASVRATENSEARSAGAHIPPPTGAPVHTGTDQNTPYRSASAPMGQTDRSTSAHHLVNQGVRGNVVPLQVVKTA